MLILELIISFCALIFVVSAIITLFYFFTAKDLMNTKLREFRNLSENMFKEEKVSSQSRRKRKERAVRQTHREKQSSSYHGSLEVEDAEFREIK